VFYTEKDKKEAIVHFRLDPETLEVDLRTE